MFYSGIHASDWMRGAARLLHAAKQVQREMNGSVGGH